MYLRRRWAVEFRLLVICSLFSRPNLPLACRMAIRCANNTFFLTVLLETNYLVMYWTDLHQIFRIGTLHMYVSMINPTYFSQSLKGVCYGNRVGKNWHTHFYSVHWHSTTDGRIATWMHVLTPPMSSLRLLKIC